jgi:hypothetical protein
MYDKWLAKEDIFAPKTSRGLNESQRKLHHQICHYFRVFDTLDEVRLTLFSPFAKDENMREFNWVFTKEWFNEQK